MVEKNDGQSVDKSWWRRLTNKIHDDRGEDAISLILVVILAGVIMTCVLTSANNAQKYQDQKAKECGKYSTSKVEDLPANCVSYYYPDNSSDTYIAPVIPPNSKY